MDRGGEVAQPEALSRGGCGRRQRKRWLVAREPHAGGEGDEQEEKKGDRAESETGDWHGRACARTDNLCSAGEGRLRLLWSRVV